ncbi:hypothetical protein [Oscillibacter sp.]|uniref:hypothetical protein n=1 Tax=Oscillibacter sp. TaxID=1945593 RepID=UPI002899640E|nr:hypothetical protein [Oscillibacter sp.]
MIVWLLKVKQSLPSVKSEGRLLRLLTDASGIYMKKSAFIPFRGVNRDITTYTYLLAALQFNHVNLKESVFCHGRSADLFFRQNFFSFYKLSHLMALTATFLSSRAAVPRPPICFRIPAKQIGGKELEKL